MRANPVFSRLPTTIFTVMSALAAEHGAINLGQGFPDEDGPIAIRESAAAALRDGPNQYPPTRGVPSLKQAIAAHAKRFYGLDFDSDRNVLVTSGGTEALTASILALTGEGGEVVLIEPAYDSYRPIALAAGARVKTLKLAPPAWRLDEGALADLVTPATRIVMLNTPLNPIGRAFDRDDLFAVDLTERVEGRAGAKRHKRHRHHREQHTENHNRHQRDDQRQNPPVHAAYTRRKPLRHIQLRA